MYNLLYNKRKAFFWNTVFVLFCFVFGSTAFWISYNTLLGLPFRIKKTNNSHAQPDCISSQLVVRAKAYIISYGSSMALISSRRVNLLFPSSLRLKKKKIGMEKLLLAFSWSKNYDYKERLREEKLWKSCLLLSSYRRFYIKEVHVSRFSAIAHPPFTNIQIFFFILSVSVREHTPCLEKCFFVWFRFH